MIHMLRYAAKLAIPNSINDYRNFWLGAVGVREDGAIVTSKNGAVECSTSVEKYYRNPRSHAEGRLLRKLGKGGTVYVARVSRKDYSFAMARPCLHCQVLLQSYKVDKVFYSINENQYGIWLPQKNIDRVYSI